MGEEAEEYDDISVQHKLSSVQRFALDDEDRVNTILHISKKREEDQV